MIHNFKDWMRLLQWVDCDEYTTQDIAAVDLEIDTLGWRFVVILVNVGDTANTWAIQVEAATATGGSFSDVTGALFSLTGSDDNSAHVGVIDTQGGATNMARFLQLTGTSIGITDLGVQCLLLNPEDSREQISYGSGGADELAFEV